MSKTIDKKRLTQIFFYLPYSLLFFLLPVNPIHAVSIQEEKVTTVISANYTTINEYGKRTHCTISSDNSIDELYELKNSDCKLPLFNTNDDQSVILLTQSDHNETKKILITTRNLLMWAHLAVHIYKVWDSGSKILWPSVCPCSGKPKIVTNTQKIFFTYYITSLVNHGWSYLSPYFLSGHLSERKKHQNQDGAEGWTDTFKNITSTFTEYPYASHLLSLAIDSAALKWDCRCAGYFTYPDGGLYFNGHLWMLLLNIAIFTTDLAIDYL
ncbi:hypothetical protein [Endozoicomonas sp.]|uniref:hypothetical protein n=1 Tax=Endozoicomonas sp. TaxID=1892382 RepID=UPI00383B1311